VPAAIEGLVAEMGMPAHLAVPDHDQGLCIQKVDSPGAVKFGTYIGRRMDLHCTALGKILLAFGPHEMALRLLSREAHIRYTANTIAGPRELQREIQTVKRLTYAVDDEEEEPAVCCVAVPVRDEAGGFVAALSVTGTSDQIPAGRVEFVAGRLRQAASELRQTVFAQDSVHIAEQGSGKWPVSPYHESRS
jgi:DNA-binding IclR family transcriptional regulator